MSKKTLFLIGSTLFLLAGPVMAQTPTPTSGADQIRDAVQQKVAEELSNIKQAVAKKAYVGTIAAVDNLDLTITNLKNQTRKAVVTTDTNIKLAGGKDGTPADLKPGDFIIAMGDADSNDVLTVKRLLVIGKPATDKREAIFITVSDTTASTLVGQTPSKEEWTVKVSSGTDYIDDTKFSDIESGNKIVAAGTVSAEKTLSASTVKVITSQ